MCVVESKRPRGECMSMKNREQRVAWMVMSDYCLANVWATVEGCRVSRVSRDQICYQGEWLPNYREHPVLI